MSALRSSAFGIEPIVGRERDPDAHADRHLVAGELIGNADGFDETRGECGRFGRQEGAGLQDRELIAAEARDEVAVANAVPEPARDGFEEQVPDRMAEQIVHLLEAIEVETEHGEALAAPHPHLHLRQLLLESRAIAQPRQRIVMRQLRDLRLGAAAVGDILVGRDPAARGDGRVLHQDLAPLRRFHDQARDVALREAAQQLDAVLLGVEIEVPAGLDAMAQQVDQYTAGLHHTARESVHLDIEIIADDDAFVGVEHDQTLRHVVDRSFQSRKMFPELRRRQPVELIAPALTGMTAVAVSGAGRLLSNHDFPTEGADRTAARFNGASRSARKSEVDCDIAN